MYHPNVEAQDPTQTYGRMLSLANMQQEMQANREMQPLRQQQAQLQVQDLQRQADFRQKAAQYWQDAEAEDQADKANATQPAQQPATPSTATLQPATSLQAGSTPANYDIPKSPDMEDQPDATEAPAAPQAVPAAPPPTAVLQPATSLQSSPTPTTPTYARVEQRFLQKMTKDGYGPEAAKIIQDRAVAQESQMKVAEMQRAQKDNDIWGQAISKHPGDLDQALKQAATDGMSPIGLGNARASINKIIDDQIKQRKDLSEAEQQEYKTKAERSDQVATRLNAYLKRPDDDSEEGLKSNWDNLLGSLHRDGQMTDAEYASTLAAHPTFPGRQAVQSIIDGHASQTWLDKQADVREKQQKADQQAQLQLITKLSASKNPSEYNQVLNDNKVPNGVYPSSSEMFDPTGKRIEKSFSALDRRGMTPEQRTVADERAITESRQLAHDKEMERIAQERVNNSPAQQNASLQDLVNKVWTDTVAAKSAGGTTPDKVSPADAIAYLKDPERWGDNEQVSAKRSALIQQFQKMNKADLDAANTQARTAKTNSGGKTPALQHIMDIRDYQKANPGKPTPDDQTLAAWKATQHPGSVTPPPSVKPPAPAAGATPPTPAAAPPPPAAPPTPPAPAKTPPPPPPNQNQKVRVNIDGKMYDFPNQAAVDLFKKDHPEYSWK